METLVIRQFIFNGLPMWSIVDQLEHTAKEDLVCTKGKPITETKKKQEEKPKVKRRERKITISPKVLKQVEKTIEDAAERIAANAKNARSCVKAFPKPKPKPRKRKFSEASLARMDQRRYNKRIELEHSLTDNQHEVLSDYAEGFHQLMIAARTNKSRQGVNKTLKTIRDRLGAKNSVHAVTLAFRRGLLE